MAQKLKRWERVKVSAVATDPLEGPLRRFDRAEAQIGHLKTEEAKFLSRGPYSSTTYFHHARKCYVFIAHVRQDPDPDLGLVAAECIYNLRAGLDNLLWSVAPTVVRRRKPQFPIYDDPLRFLCEAYPAMQGLPAKLFEAVEWCQPYNKSLTSPERLVALNALWNADKHRAPLAVGSVAEAFAVGAYGEPPVTARLTEPHKALYEGKEIGWVRGLLPDLEDKLNPPIHFRIAFSALDAERVYQLDALVKMHDIVTNEVVPAIRAAL
jgi:hypothetical protein